MDDDEPEDDRADLDLDHHAEWCKDNPIERALEETVQSGKYTTPRYVVQEGEPSMYGRSEVVVDTATGRELCDAWCNEAPEDATVHRAFKPLLDELNALAAELTRLRAELAHANELREHYYQNWRGVSGALMDASSVNAGDPQEVGVRELIAQRDRLRAVAEAARVALLEIARPGVGPELHDTAEERADYWAHACEVERQTAREALAALAALEGT